MLFSLDNSIFYSFVLMFVFIIRIVNNSLVLRNVLLIIVCNIGSNVDKYGLYLNYKVFIFCVVSEIVYIVL